MRLRVPDVAAFPAPGVAPVADVRGPLEHVLQNVSDAFVALDTSWRYVYVNRRAADLFGTTPDQLVGQEIWTLYPEGAESDFHPRTCRRSRSSARSRSRSGSSRPGAGTATGSCPRRAA